MLLDAETIVELFARRVETSGPELAIGMKRDGQFVWRSWDELAADVRKLAAVLAELGVVADNKVAHVSENRYEWIVADLAIQLCQAVHVPIHPTLAGPQIAWQIGHCGAYVVLVSGRHQMEKLQPLADQLNPELDFIAYDACDLKIGQQRVQSLSALCAGTVEADGLALEREARRQIQPRSLATILYTSGTTGEPKGVMLSQGNLASNACSTIRCFGHEADQVRLGFLPLSHIFARTCDLYAWLVEGSRLAIAESRETVVADCQLVRPTTLNGVPYFFDKVYRGLCEKGVHEHPGAARAALGGAIEKCNAGGAALPDHLYEYYLAQGVPVLQGYGLSETSPVITLSTPSQHRRGSCGRAIPGIEVKIAEDGEILTRGPHVMQGYFENAAATAEVLRDGWLATGDLGRLDDEGFLYITGRKKEILVTSSGKNIAPVFLESLLTQDPLIVQAMVLGDGRSYLTALVVANREALRAELGRRGVSGLAADEELSDARVVQLYAERIVERLACVSPHEQVRKFTLLGEPFSIESGELTPKLSLRRGPIAKRYAAVIEGMYAREKGCG